jgi:hypothetical protein
MSCTVDKTLREHVAKVMPKSEAKPQETRFEKMDRWIRDQFIFAVLILVAAGVVGVSELTEKGSDLLVSLGLKQEKALRLADDNAKGELSRKVIELAYRRKFWTENYIARLKRDRPQPELDYTWNKHLDAVADWSAELMVTTNGMDKFYKGSDKPNQFQSIHSQFSEVESKCIVPLRKFIPSSEKHTLNTKEIAERDAAADVAQEAEDQLGFDLYCFSQGVTDPKNRRSSQESSSCAVRDINPEIARCVDQNKPGTKPENPTF